MLVVVVVVDVVAVVLVGAEAALSQPFLCMLSGEVTASEDGNEAADASATVPNDDTPDGATDATAEVEDDAPAPAPIKKGKGPQPLEGQSTTSSGSGSGLD